MVKNSLRKAINCLVDPNQFDFKCKIEVQLYQTFSLQYFHKTVQKKT